MNNNKIEKTPEQPGEKPKEKPKQASLTARTVATLGAFLASLGVMVGAANMANDKKDAKDPPKAVKPEDKAPLDLKLKDIHEKTLKNARLAGNAMQEISSLRVLRRYDEALDVIRNTRANNPQEALRLQELLGYVYADKGDYNQSIAEFKQVGRKTPQKIDPSAPWDSLAEVYEKAGKKDLAEQKKDSGEQKLNLAKQWREIRERLGDIIDPTSPEAKKLEQDILKLLEK